MALTESVSYTDVHTRELFQQRPGTVFLTPTLGAVEEEGMKGRVKTDDGSAITLFP